MNTVPILAPDHDRDFMVDSASHRLFDFSTGRELASSPSDSTYVGARLGPYEILASIGAGGMGEVYLAQDVRLERNVAIKLLPPRFITNPESVRRFEREAKSASALNHPNIITIYEVGEANGSRYIAAEYIEGKTLRQHCRRQRMSVREVLDAAIQVASALSAAHRAGIIHRDIKPENVMLRPDGYVKVLDFGLVKLSEERRMILSTDGSTINETTEPGKVMGTVRYMSPEQARGQTLDGQSDIFSLGVMLYEMITGRAPFEGDSVADIFAAILQKEPLPIENYLSDVPQELQRVVSKALRKDRYERYQRMSDLLADLNDLREELQLQSKLERFPASYASGNEPDQKTLTLLTEGLQRSIESGRSGASSRSVSSAEYLVDQIKSHRQSVMIFFAMLLVATVTAAFYFNRSPVLTEHDTILLSDFVNTTGDSIFDGTLKQGLAVQLGQSPFLHLFPDVRVRQTLRLMGRSPDERVTAEIGSEICERQGLKALIVGAIAPLGTHYVITLEAANGRSGEVLAREQTEAESKEQVLTALSLAASRMRQRLGESLGSIQKFDAPLEVTTSSLEALKAFSLGVEQTQSGKFLEAIPFYKRAVELDPDFAYAYGTLAVNYYNTKQPRLAAEYAEKAFALRDRMSELEKLRITSFYYAFVTGEVDKGIETVQLYKSTYPRDERGPLNLSDRYGMIGQFEKAVEEANRALVLNPNNAVAYWNLADSLTHLSRFSEAKETCETAIQQKLDTIALHYFLYQIAFAEQDAAGMQQQLAWAGGRLDEYMALDWQNGSAAFSGQWQLAQDYSRRSIDLAIRSDAKEVAARYAADSALRAAVFGNCNQARQSAAQSLALERNQVSMARLTLALALCGEGAQTESLVEELAKRYPKNTLINQLWLPTIRAAVELQRNNPGRAVELLEEARRYESAAEFWPQYLRGIAYLRLKSGNEARVEFQRILNNRGEATLSALYPLARLGLARAAALTGDMEKSRKEYECFLELWKNADPDLPILIEAKRGLVR
ncbi:MAG TPA: protein kinase [Blastocatellia bacterium]|nr:protein kinase [Blastocatellia bacterium]